jgi:uncharacterized protein with GYD domain
MTTYIALFSLTDAGIKAAKDSPRRLDAAKKLLTDMSNVSPAVMDFSARPSSLRSAFAPLAVSR